VPLAPCPTEEVVAAIYAQQPCVVLAPHVETACGILLCGDYVRRVTAAAHDIGAIVVLDRIASGTTWLDIRPTGADVVVSASQKGWSSVPGCAMVMLSE
jgi:alanine-glyoxylate transaminase / serine-glyoxylate transaminase / serine-pyruvate transaminase